MASQITHIVLSEKLKDDLFSKFNKKEFILGCIFPDIRYLKVIKREETHFKDLSIKDILTETDSFMAGMKYHSLTDEVREKYVLNAGLYDLFPESKFKTQALKLYEDEILFSFIESREDLMFYLHEIIPKETHVVSEEKVKIWHKLISDYIFSTSFENARREFILGLGYSIEVVNEIEGLITEIKKNMKIRDKILNMYNNWDNLIK